MLLWFPWIVWSGLLTLPDQRPRGEWSATRDGYGAHRAPGS